MDLDQCLCISRLSGRLGDTGLRDLLQQARDHHRLHDITGALLFDGDRFVQLIEGPSTNVRAFLAALRGDPRHMGFQLLVDRTVPRRLSTRWTSGYVELEAVDRFVLVAAEAASDAEVLLSAYETLLKSADLD